MVDSQGRASCDWSRGAYTFDEQRSKAVYEMFRRMYDDGLIYRGYRVVNWSVKGQSTCSDEELVYVERDAKLYTFKYSKDFPIPIATTRPETKLGDTAVAVNPQDKRYKKFIGQTFTIDFGVAKPLTLRIIGDAAVDPEFGTGALGVTPAHSMIDFDMKEKNGLELVQVIGPDGCMTAEAGGAYAGKTVEVARDAVVQRLKKEGLLISEADIKQNVATSDRFGDVIEVIPMLQWFVGVNRVIPNRDGKTLKDLMRDAGGKIDIQPVNFKKIYDHWIDSLHDWCISRQIWWGHRMPVWYRDKSKVKIQKSKVGAEDIEIYVGTQPPKGVGWLQDEDTLDTWFSSGTWTFSTLGWPDKTKDLATFHPTSWMQMGYELVFFWMARMILMSEYALKEIPFKQVYIHGLVRDEHGKKFSKSLRNAIDPIDMVQKYGADALRMSMLAGVAPGSDLSFYEEKVEHYQHFVNKLWNISRYIFGTVEHVSIPSKIPQTSTLSDQWILGQLHTLIKGMTEKLENSDFSLAAKSLYSFTWSDFADWYIEVAKIEARRSPEAKQQKDAMLLYVLHTLLRLAHPFVPFVSEVLWDHFGEQDSLMITPWPDQKFDISSEAQQTIFRVQEIITAIREHRSTNKIPIATIVTVRTMFPAGYKDVIEKLGRCTVEQTGSDDVLVQAVSTLTDAKRTELQTYIQMLEKKLANKAFVKNAPAPIIAQERKKLTDAKKKLE